MMEDLKKYDFNNKKIFIIVKISQIILKLILVLSRN